MPTIFAIDGAEEFGEFGYLGELGAYSSSVASLQAALIGLGQKVGDATLSALVLDGLIGPKTTTAANRAFAMYVSGAPANYATGTLTQSQVSTNAASLATYVNAELQRRGGGAAPAKPTALVPAAPAYVPAPAISDNTTKIVKWSAIGLGGVVVASIFYYLWRMRQGRPAFSGFGEVSLHERIAQALNWPLRDVESMSLPSLRDLVRPVDRRLAEEISEAMAYTHAFVQRASRRRPRRGGFGAYYEEEERAARNAQIAAKNKSHHAEVGDREYERGKIGKAVAWTRHQGAIRALMDLRQKARAAHDDGMAREAEMLIRWHKNVIETRYRPTAKTHLGDDRSYTTFIRSASASGRGRKRTVDRGLTYDEARRACQNYNASRSSREIKRGTKMEFTQE